jgi:molybdopterin/thiamine biosynthesis adenylyltransferase
VSFSVAMAGALDSDLRSHLLQHEDDEDVCFGLYRPSRGAERFNGLVFELILPEPGERQVHGNASISSGYLLRAIDLAAQAEAGLVFLHSHSRHSRGWQQMSRDDIATEQTYAPRVQAQTKLPLLGMTLAGDGAWSARYWERVGRGLYARRDAENVRVVGHRLAMTFHPQRRPVPALKESLTRTVSSWGPQIQADLSRLRVGVIGAGSVGVLVAEALVRTGVVNVRLIDFDSVKRVNLDRLLHASERDVRLALSKVESARRGLLPAATAADPVIETLERSVVEEEGFRAALDCDVLFSCVDRPWPRAALNLIAYAHLVPVIDGGIRVRVRNQRLRSADWRAHVVGPGRQCLECLGQYDPQDVTLERQGDLDDPSYIEGLPPDSPFRSNENVFGFALAAASLEVQHFLRLVVAPGGMADIGSQHENFKTGSIDLDIEDCHPNCWHSGRLLARGDGAGIDITGRHPAAERERAERLKRQRHLTTRWRRWTCAFAHGIGQLA